MLRKSKSSVSKRTGDAELALPEGTLELIRERGYSVEGCERAASLGNLMLVLSRGRFRLRFIRDRGYCLCEKGRAGMWSAVDLDPKAAGIGYDASDEEFFRFVEYALAKW